MEMDETSYISYVPSEVLESIFSFLDGRSFCIVRQVCKIWDKVIKNMQVKNKFWKQFCLREISQNVLEEILWFKSSSWSDIHWMSVYKKWFQSKLILTSPFWKRKIDGFLPNPISCIAVSGSWIITGHSNGLLCIWNLHNGSLHQNIMCHLRIISDMALVDLLNLGSYYGSEELPWSHHHLISISKDRYIHVLSLLEPMTFEDNDAHVSCHGDDLKQIIVFGDIFAVSCRDNTVSLWKMALVKKPFYCLEISLLQKIIGPEDVLLSIGFWHNKVQCVSYSGRLKSLDFDENVWVEKKYLKESNAEGGRESIVQVTAAFIFRSETVIMLTADGKLIVSIGEKQNRHYCLMKQLQTSLVSVALHGTILALGGENGKLFLYHVSSEDELIKLELSKPDVSILLSEASIISIHISYQDDSPVIVASTTDIVHIIKWYKPGYCQLRKREIIPCYVPL